MHWSLDDHAKIIILGLRAKGEEKELQGSPSFSNVELSISSMR